MLKDSRGPTTTLVTQDWRNLFLGTIQNTTPFELIPDALILPFRGRYRRPSYLLEALPRGFFPPGDFVAWTPVSTWLGRGAGRQLTDPILLLLGAGAKEEASAGVIAT